MKRIFLLLSLSFIFSFISLRAQEIPREQILKASQTFTAVKKTQLKKSLAKVSQIQVSEILDFTHLQTNEKLGTIVRLKPKGFLVFSNDKNIKPVIAYSFNSDFPDDPDDSNPLYYMLQQDLKLRKDNIKNFPLGKKLSNQKLWKTYTNSDFSETSSTFYQWPPEGTTSTGGWVNTV